MSDRKLLCFARGRDGDWEAICLDFDIAVHGRSFDEVRGLLDEAIRTYVIDATSEAPADRDRLLSRAAPLRVRVSLAASYLWHLLAPRGRSNDYQAGFDLPCRA